MLWFCRPCCAARSLGKLEFSTFPLAETAPFLFKLTSTGSEITGEFSESAGPSAVEYSLLFAAFVSFALVEPDFVDFFPKSTDLIHFAGDFPHSSRTEPSNAANSGT
uniref:Uncharacterized protein n=1 Tax=Arundo donax TaxID=35708 RepID=A0A0A9E0L6_ARUDO